MLYTFIGGPLAGQSFDVQPEQLDKERGNYIFLEWGKPKPFQMCDPLTIHQYLPIGNEMHWIEPDRILK